MENNKPVRPFIMGVLLTDEWPASPNMGETQEGASKIARMKFVRTSEGNKTILSGQAVGSWHRKTLYDRYGWPVSELQETVSSRDTRNFYTQCQPIEYAEDDGRGYMAAVSLTPSTKSATKGEPVKTELTTKRTSPFMLSQFQSVAPNVRFTDYGILARNLDDLPDEVKGGLIFKAEIASAAYAGLFALNLSEIGVFSVGVGRDLLPFSTLKNIVTKEIRNIYKKPESERNTEEHAALDPILKALKRCVDTERGAKIALPDHVRKHRAAELVAALADLEGGAHMTRRLYNVAPSTALIVYMNGGNCLPPHVIRAVVRDEDANGNKTYKFVVDIPRLHKVLADNKDRLLSDTQGISVFFGTLGAPSIANEEAVISFLNGEDDKHPLPNGIKCFVGEGPRQAINQAATAVPVDWFHLPEGAIPSDNVRYGEALLTE